MQQHEDELSLERLTLLHLIMHSQIAKDREPLLDMLQGTGKPGKQQIDDLQTYAEAHLQWRK